jgi:thiol-disulfide isomerase/thioredoxin
MMNGINHQQFQHKWGVLALITGFLLSIGNGNICQKTFAADEPPAAAVSTSPSPAPSSSVISAHESIYFSKPEGVLEEVSLTPKTLVVAVATWCPHCHHFISLLNDPDMAPFLKDVTIRFVLQDEWPRIEQSVAQSVLNENMNKKLSSKALELKIESKLKAIREKSGNRLVYDPEILKILPAPYLFNDENSQKKNPATIQYFPACYSKATQQFDKSPLVCLMESSGMPEEKLMEFAKRYHMVND